MKRLRSYGDDLGSSGEKELDRTSSLSSSSHRRFHLKVGENGRIRPGIDDDRDRDTPRGSRKRIDYDIDGFEDRDGSRSFRKRSTDHDLGENLDDRDVLRGGRKYHDLDAFDDRETYRSSRKRVDYDVQESFDGREGSRALRKRFEHDNDGFDRRKGFDRYRERDGSDKGGMASSVVSSRVGYSGGRERDKDRERDRDRDRMHRFESFCAARREIPKGIRSERDRSKREDSVSSWRSFHTRSKREAHEETKTFAVEKPVSSGSRGGGDGGSSRESLRSPQTMKDMRSPTWSKESKDSGGETLKPVKKNESLAVESGGSSNAAEIEEGELEPEPHLENEQQSVQKKAVEEHVDDEERIHADTEVNDYSSCQKMESVMTANVKLCEDQQIVELKEDVDITIEQHKMVEAAEEDVPRETSSLSVIKCVLVDKVSGANAVQLSEVQDNADGVDEESLKQDHTVCSAPADSKPGIQDSVEVGGSPMDTALTSAPEGKVGNNINLEIRAEVASVPEPSSGVAEDDPKELELQVHALKDKGKGVVVCSPEDVSFREADTLIERNFIGCRDDAMEGPSTRGFELFSTCVGSKVNQGNLSDFEREKLKLEPLDLTLGLPNVSLPGPSSPEAAPPNSPPHARSIQSLDSMFLTGSDCFTTSISFSGSQFIHNPSCSLTHNSVDCDFEQSVKSRPLFLGFDWQAHSANDSKHNEVLAFPKALSNVNGSIHLSNASQGVFSGQPLPVLQGMPFGLDRSGSFKRQLSCIKARYPNDVRSPTQSTGSHDTKSECGRDKKLAAGEESGGRLFRTSSQMDMEAAIARGAGFFERIIAMIVSEPIHIMSWRIREMSEEAIACLKDHTCEMIEKEDRRGKLHALQEVLKNRSDLTLDSLSKGHRVQLEILASLKTGHSDFLHRADGSTSVDLAELFLCLKCRNLNCRSALPVDDCECKFCSRKDGFCSSCMCLVCSKFDMASNTCSWVGCDMCWHWCHTDCGLKNSYIRNGHSDSSSQGTSEMHFYCVACGHPSEMFGFVKDVFNTCAPEWKAETMLNELEYVKRIFRASNDIRGKSLHDLVSKLLARLQNSGSLAEVRHQIITFLAESDSKFINALENKGDGSSSAAAAVDVETTGVPSVFNSMKKTAAAAPMAMAEIARAPPPAPKTEGSSGCRGVWNLDEQGQGQGQGLGQGGRKNNNNMPPVPVVESSGSRGIWEKKTQTNTTSAVVVMDELEGIVQIKQAEAQMFQTRADDARREAEGLKRIAIAKSKRVEEEYAARVTKLHLGETEERRRQKLEELQILERSHREYSNMKSRMEADIKDLLLKMEATKET
ncbi:hypothetical protein Dimus_011741 [Dionaea muscipula]